MTRLMVSQLTHRDGWEPVALTIKRLLSLRRSMTLSFIFFIFRDERGADSSSRAMKSDYVDKVRGKVRKHQEREHSGSANAPIVSFGC